jgi:hypothetical protein
MTSFLGHLLLLVLAGFALFRLWLGTRSTDRWLNAAIAAGFAVRALLGAALFWISYLHLPIARSLQKGDGLWFFAVDAFQYYPQALGLAKAGVWTIITFDRTVAAVAFVQAFGTAILLFGRVASVALVLNAFCYLGAMWILVRSSAQNDRARIAARIAVIAISFSPTFILWSLQPLKDTMFQFLVVAFIAACAAWQRVWISSTHGGRAAAFGAAMAAALYLLSALRWYFAFMVLLAATAFAILVAFRAPRRKAVSFAAAALMLFVLSRAFLFGAGPYVPPPLHDALTPTANGHAIAGVASMMGDRVEHAREGFERSGGATQIGLGGNLAKLDAKAAPAGKGESPDPPRTAAESHSKPETEARLSPDDVARAKQSSQQAPRSAQTPAAETTAQPASKKTNVPSVSTTTAPIDARSSTAPGPNRSPAAGPAQLPVIPLKHSSARVPVQISDLAPAHSQAPAPAALQTSGPVQPPSEAAPSHTTPPAPSHTTSPAPSHTTPPAPSHTPPPAPSHAPSPAPSHTPPLPPVHAAGSVPSAAASETQPTSVNTGVADATPKSAPHRIHQRVAARKKTTKPATAAETSPAIAVPAPATTPAPPPPAVIPNAPAPQAAEQPIVVPASRLARFAAGTAAVLVPRALGQRAGLFAIGGGKGLWWFSDLDTIVFDLVALFAVCLTWRWLRAASLRNPMFWLVAALTILIAVPLVYTVTNFGTLLRLREMIYLGLLLIPLALATAQPSLIPEPVVEAGSQAGSGSALSLPSNASIRPL